MFQSSLPIGFFDSGVGGLTVVKEVVKALAHENLIYFGDTARFPYGNQSPDTILRFSLENGNFLMQQKIKLLIVSCHTACSHALDTLQRTLPIPVLGITDVALPDLIAATKSKKIALLGTPSTISSGIFQTLLQDQKLQIYPVECPLLASLAEEGLAHHRGTKLIVEHYLSPLKKTGIDAALLACTHYPLLTSVIQKILGPAVHLINPARSAALAALKLLKNNSLLNPQTSPPHYRFFVSSDPEKFHRSAENILPFSIEKVQLA